MRRYFTDLEKLLLILAAFTLGFFVEIHAHIWLRNPTGDHLVRILLYRVGPVVLFTLVVWMVLRTFFVE